MHKNAFKLERKRRSKFPSTTVDYSLLRISCLDYALSGSKPSRRSATAAKR